MITPGHPIRFRPTELLAWARERWCRFVAARAAAREARACEMGVGRMQAGLLRCLVCLLRHGSIARGAYALGSEPCGRCGRCHEPPCRPDVPPPPVPTANGWLELPPPDPELRNPIGKDGMGWPPQGGSGLRPKPPATAVPGPGKRESW